VIGEEVLANHSGISGQVVATVYGLATEIYHELPFNELRATRAPGRCL
jgi:hypothetical protein